MSCTQRLPDDHAGLSVARLFGVLGSRTETAVSQLVPLWQALRARHPVVAGLTRRALLILWWICTLQLHRQLPLWLRARRRRQVIALITPPTLIEHADADSLVVPCTEHPSISIIIPSYGQTGFTLRCLASIAANPPTAPFEVIVVDDAFPGTETACLEHVRGIRLRRNAVNRGFLRSCNAAAEIARGEFLLFLNNDTQVTADWADAMLTLLYKRRDVGAVGSKLLYPTGLLQEAGGIIWCDGSGWNFGREDHPDRSAYNYVREVDYCSGASLMVRREVFHRLGGFDARYAPAYYEDTDLCFRLRAIGLKTLYQPRSVVVHYEGVSHGRDTMRGVKSYQAGNRRNFVTTWAAALVRDHYSNAAHVLRARDRARHRPVVLVVDHKVPEYDRDAGSRAILCVVQTLLAEGMVVKFWPHNMTYQPGYVEALQDCGVEVAYAPHQVGFEDWMREFGAELDLVVLSRPDVAEACVSAVRAHSSARVIYYGHDLHFSRMRMQGTLLRDESLLAAADRMEEREREVWRKADAVLYLSEDEAAAVLAMAPGVAVHAVIPYCFTEFGETRPAPPAHEIMFVAGFAHQPNEDAACWFVSDVLPLIHARLPDAKLSIVGSNPTDRVRMLASEAVSVTADVSDDALTARYRRVRVAVVPLRCGAGVKLKVVEALKEGVPLVTTPVGAQGLPGLAAVACVCDGAASFAEAVCMLLCDDAAWQQRSAAQLEYAHGHFSEAALHQSVIRAISLPPGKPLPQGDANSRIPVSHKSADVL